MLLAVLALIIPAEGRTLVVDPSGSGDSKTLAGAIASATPGDEIVIVPGIHQGATVDRRINLSGSGQAAVNGGGSSALVITASGCRISNLTITGCGASPGIALQSAENVLEQCLFPDGSTGIRIAGMNNTVMDCSFASALGIELSGPGCRIFRSTFRGDAGVSIRNSSESFIENCVFSGNSGVELVSSSKNRIERSTFSAGVRFGISLSRSSGNRLLENSAAGGYLSGIDLLDSGQNLLSGNRVEGCKLGISLRQSPGCRLINNSCSRNERAGIYLAGSRQAEITGNLLSENGNGILLASSESNLLSSNSLARNIYGISLRGAGKNTLKENNLSNNRYNIRVDPGEGSASGPDPYIQEMDVTNKVDGRPVCYLVSRSGGEVPQGCGFVGLIGCENVSVRNQAISNSSAAILMVNSTGCRAFNCTLERSETGISILQSRNFVVTGSTAVGCKAGFSASRSRDGLFELDIAERSESGFLAEGSENISIKSSAATSNQVGASLKSSPLCKVQGCNMSQSKEAGIFLVSSHRCALTGNVALRNERGISLSGSNGCTLSQNNASANRRDGLALEQLSGALVSSNAASANGQGIFVQSSRRVELAGNSLSSNLRHGLRMSLSSECNVTENAFVGNGISGASLVDCTGNRLYHNILAGNGYQNAADNGQNQWDGGAELGGNYWSDHPVQGDPSSSPRPVPTKGVDRYPFQTQGGWR
jgi:parallel beta-helix repeat protein